MTAYLWVCLLVCHISTPARKVGSLPDQRGNLLPWVTRENQSARSNGLRSWARSNAQASMTTSVGVASFLTGVISCPALSQATAYSLASGVNSSVNGKDSQFRGTPPLIAVVEIDSSFIGMPESSPSGEDPLSMKAKVLDLDIDISFRFVYGKRPEVNLGVSGVPSGFDAVYEAMPRTNNVHIRFIPVLAMNLFCAVHHFDDTRQDTALANRTTGVSTGVVIGVELVVQPKNTDCDTLIDFHDQSSAIGQRIAPADEHLSNSGCWYRVSLLIFLPFQSMRC